MSEIQNIRLKLENRYPSRHNEFHNESLALNCPWVAAVCQNHLALPANMSFESLFPERQGVLINARLYIHYIFHMHIPYISMKNVLYFICPYDSTNHAYS